LVGGVAVPVTSALVLLVLLVAAATSVLTLSLFSLGFLVASVLIVILEWLL
jgi:hypothetical protein